MTLHISTKNILKALGAATLSSIILLTYRIFATGEFIYLFLVWNLFLAWLPLLFAIKLGHWVEKKKKFYFILSLFCLWLLFFPNAPYIITDLLHLKQRENFPMWFDIVLITSFAWTGLLLGFASLLKVQKIMSQYFNSAIGWVLSCGVLIISSFGIYLGRFQRWNSWDLFTTPIGLLYDISRMLLNPMGHPRVIGVTLAFSLFLITSYFTIYVFTANGHNLNNKRHE